jgi:TolA-binding protein
LVPWLVAAGLLVSWTPADGGVAELERLRASVQSGAVRPASLAPARVLDGLRPEQRREALYLLSLVPARRERIDEVLEPLADGRDELAERAALDRLHLAMLVGDVRAAAALAEAFRIAHPGSAALPQALLLLARSRLQAGEIGRASELFLQVLLRFPSGEEARLAQIGLGDCALAEGKLTEAQAQFELAVKHAGEQSECPARLRLVEAARRQGNKQAASAFAEQLFQACPDGIFAQEAWRRWPDLAPLTAASGPTGSAVAVAASGSATAPSSRAAHAAEPTALPADAAPAVVWVQIGAYSERANAERLVTRLAAERASITIDEVVLSGRTIFKVLYGPFASEREAQPAVHRLEEKHNLFGFIIRR